MNASVATNANVTRIDRIILRLLSVGSCRHSYPVRGRPTLPGLHELGVVGPTRSGCRACSARVPGWLAGRLRLVVGHASTVRPDPSTLGGVGGRGSRHEGCSPARPG